MSTKESFYCDWKQAHIIEDEKKAKAEAERKAEAAKDIAGFWKYCKVVAAIFIIIKVSDFAFEAGSAQKFEVVTEEIDKKVKEDVDCVNKNLQEIQTDRVAEKARGRRFETLMNFVVAIWAAQLYSTDATIFGTVLAVAYETIRTRQWI
jgi:hypothetical protein